MLAVDDGCAFRAALRLLVETWTSALVAEAESGERAVELVRELQPDLVLMDVRMPGLGGIRATAAIKALRPETVVMLVSSMRPDELAHEAGSCAADAVVWKGDLRPRVLDELWARFARGRAGAGTASSD